MTEIKKHLAEAAINIVTGARRGNYGKPENNFHRIALLWQAWFDARGITMREPDAQPYRLQASDVSPMMRLMKEARLCETPNHYDSHLDIIGYAMTGAEVCNVQQPDQVFTLKDIQGYEAQISALMQEVERLNIALASPFREQPYDTAIREQLHASSDPATASSEPDHSDAVQEQGHTSQ